MERKKINSIIVLLLIGILLSVSLFPFPINAEVVAGDSPIIGVNIKYRDYDVDHEPYQLSASLEMPHRWQCVSSHSTMGCQAWSSQDTSGTIQDEITGYINVSNGSYTDILYEYEFILDKSYVGYIVFSTNISATTTTRYYVNGTSLTLTSKQLITSFTVSSYHLDYAPLEVIDMFRTWNMPIESYGFNISLLNNNFEIQSFQNMNSFNYPLFYIPANRTLLGFTVTPNDFSVVIYIDKSINDRQTLEQYISITGSNFTYDYTQISLFQNVGRCLRLDFHTTNGQSNVVYMKALQDIHIMGIFEGIPSNYFTTDFALLYGFNNQLLNDLHLIAQGTQQSQTSSGSLDQTTSQFSSDANDLVTIEETFNSSMNQSLQNVNPTFNMGSSFLASANWVSTQFNRIVNNTPFASLITFGLTLGLGLLIIGKVRK